MANFQDLPAKTIHYILDLAVFPHGHHHLYPPGEILRLSPIAAFLLRFHAHGFAQAIPYPSSAGVRLTSQSCLEDLRSTLLNFEQLGCRCHRFDMRQPLVASISDKAITATPIFPFATYTSLNSLSQIQSRMWLPKILANFSLPW